MKEKLRILLFAGLLMSLALVNIIKEDNSFSSKENRFLQMIPALSQDRFLAGTFGSEFEVYTSDQFIYRNQWIGLKTLSDLTLGKKDNGRVYFGREGYLFDIDEKLDEEQIEKNIEYINKFMSGYEDKLKISALLVPTKSQVYLDQLPKNAPMNDEDQIVEMLKGEVSASMNWIEVKDEFKKYEYDGLYYKTDHHWTSLGAFTASRFLLDLEENDLNKYHPSIKSENFYGTSYRKVNDFFTKPDIIQTLEPKTKQDLKILIDGNKLVDSLYDESYLSKTDQYAYFMGGDHAVVEIDTGIKNGKTLLMIKDSFANSLVPFLTQNYERIVMVDPRYHKAGISTILSTQEFDEVLFVFNTQTFVQDKSMFNISR